MNRSIRRLTLLLGALLSCLTVFFACHLGGTQEAEETFSFPTLKDSIGTADSVLIVLKDQGGRVVDTLFNEKVTASTRFTDLKAEHYDGGKVVIFIEATKDGKLVYKVERGFDPAQGGNIEGTKVVHVSPSISVDFDWSDPKMVEGETAQLPKLIFTPSELANKKALFISRQPSILAADSASLRAIKAGNATLVVCLQADTARCDSLVVVVSAKPDQKIPDSLFLSPDPLELSLGGTDRFTVRVSPSTASSDVQWVLVSGTAIRLDSNGTLNALGEGTSKVAAISKLNAKVSDTATVTVLPIVTPNRPKVEGPILPVNTLTPQWTWTSGGNGGNGTYRYRLDNPDLSAAPTTTDLSFTAPSNLSEGTHTLFVQERNAAGNWSQNGSWPVRIDTTAPKAPSVSTKESSPTAVVRPTWTWAGDTGDAHRYYRYKLDSDDFRNGAKDTRDTSFRPDSDLSNGTHILYVQERDTAGNWSSSGSASIVIDTVRPAAPTVSGPALTNDSTPTWTWTTATAGTVTFRYRLDNQDLSTGAATTTQKEFTPASNLAEGPHTLYVQERDAAGNWSNTGSREIRLDLTKPTEPRIDSTPYSPLNSLRPRFTWKIGTGGAKVFRARIDNADLSGVAEQGDSSFAPLGDLSEGGHTVYVQERDTAGNWSTVISRKIYLSTQKVSTVATSSSYGTSIAIRTDGTPFVASANPSSSGEIKLYGYLNDAWQFVSTAPISTMQPPVLLADTKGNVLVGQGNGESGRPTVALYNGSSWQEVGGLTFDTVSAGTLRMAKNYSDELLAAYLSDHSTVRVKRFNGSAWLQLNPIQEIFVNSFYHALAPALSKDGTPFLATTSLSRLTVRKFTGGSWDVLGEEEFATASANEITLALSKVDEPIVAFADNSSENKLSVRKFTGGQWVPVGGTTISSGSVSRVCLNTTSSGKIVVAYLEQYLGATSLKVQAFDENQWRLMGNSVAVVDGNYLSLSVNEMDIPFVSFYEPAGGGSIKVLRTSFNP